MSKTSFRAWVSPLIHPSGGKWGRSFDVLTPEQKQLYRELHSYFMVYGDSEYPDALAYLSRNKFTYKLTHIFRTKKGGRK